MGAMAEKYGSLVTAHEYAPLSLEIIGFGGFSFQPAIEHF
jgi:hypothetical protein